MPSINLNRKPACQDIPQQADFKKRLDFRKNLE